MIEIPFSTWKIVGKITIQEDPRYCKSIEVVFTIVQCGQDPFHTSCRICLAILFKRHFLKNKFVNVSRFLEYQRLKSTRNHANLYLPVIFYFHQVRSFLFELMKHFIKEFYLLLIMLGTNL